MGVLTYTQVQVRLVIQKDIERKKPKQRAEDERKEGREAQIKTGHGQKTELKIITRVEGQ